MNAAAAMIESHPTPALPRALHLVDPLPGLPGHSEFSLTPLDDIGVLFALRSLPDDAQSIRLFVVTPGAFFPDYAPDVRPHVRASIGAGDGSVATLVVVSPSADGSAPTANLLAPLVLDPVTGQAVQTVLDGDLPLRAPLGAPPG
ncbi:flagellar assembly protein FliW [Cellulomonas sp.]|uniref:flagellar assembly protein FliW n=1 Tax=Cellulomonas sp. TaxID=40001 RepID=UPI0025BDBA5A|nr:flagellar assembly protein FliW [Cellulomonas sp.]